jgi:hypothetical protein
MYGCDQYPPSDYVPYTNTSVLSIKRYGDMMLSVCQHPEPRPILASVILISFILLCGFILVSLTVASVTSGINERLKELEVEGEEIHQQEAEEGQEQEQEGKGKGGPQEQNIHGSQSSPAAPVPSGQPNHDSSMTVQRSFSHLLRGESASRLNPMTHLHSNPSSATPHRSLLTHREMLLMVLIQLWRKEELFLASTQATKSKSARYTPTPAGSADGKRRNQNFNSVSTNYCLYRIEAVWVEALACFLAFQAADLRSMSIHMRAMTNHPLYKYLLAATIACAAMIEIVLLESDNASTGFKYLLRLSQIFLQIFFTVDVMCQALSHYPSWESYFQQKWNQYDLALILITWIPILATGLAIQKYLGEYISLSLLFDPLAAHSSSPLSPSLSSLLPLPSPVLLRVLRILRLLRLLSWIPELNIIMRAISSSAIALFYVILLVFLFFFHFAIAGVLLFKTNDPQHFKTFFRAMVTLFQVTLPLPPPLISPPPHPSSRSLLWITGPTSPAPTCDLLHTHSSHSSLPLHRRYGCDFYGYETGDLEYDSQCEQPQGLGWFAAWYFAIFIVFGVFVLISLFVGVIITSMELLREGIQEENEVWRKVKLMQKSHTLNDASIDNLLEIFNLVDTGQNGKLTVSTTPIL